MPQLFTEHDYYRAVNTKSQLKKDVKKMPLKTRLQLYLEQSGASQIHVAKALGMPAETINRFLKGHRPMPRRWIPVIDRYLTKRGY